MDHQAIVVSADALRFLLVGVLLFVPMVFEARLATRNERRQHVRGGVEPQGDVYRLMQVAYPGVFLAMLVEGGLRVGGLWLAPFVGGLIVFLAGKALKYRAIATLGPCWTFRVIVVPGTAPVVSGPYRFLSHPNYVGVAGELLGAALMTGARVTGPIGAALFIALMLRRVAVENRARDAILRRS